MYDTTLNLFLPPTMFVVTMCSQLVVSNGPLQDKLVKMKEEYREGNVHSSHMTSR
jgi:hypothetical protein